MTEYLIQLSGCHENTLVVVALAPGELATIERVARLVKAAAGGDSCKPEIQLVPVAEVKYPTDLTEAYREAS